MSNKSYLSVYAKSFSWAGFFLPKKTLEKCSALYDFCRVADNIADDNENIENKEKKFNHFENNFNQKNFDDPIIKNMWDLIEEFNISLKIVQDLLMGIKSDIKDKVKLDTKQLTNISRDVIEDSKNNRLYINENFKEILSTINLADTFYENSFYSIKDIPISFRFSILVARRVYRKIGHKIKNKKNLENYLNSGKIYVSNVEKVLETFLSIFDLIRLSFSHKLDDEIQHDHNLINEEINLNERI